MPLALLTIHGAPLRDVRAAAVEAIAAHGSRDAARSEEASVRREDRETRISAARDQVEAARAALADARKVREEERRKRSESSAANEDESGSELDRALRRRESEEAEKRIDAEAGRAIRALERDLASAEATLRTLEQDDAPASQPARAPSRPDVFPHLPAPVRSWTTDTDGRATIRVPAGERWVIWASATRQVVSSEERYRWLVALPETQRDDETLYLSGDNLHDDDVPAWLRP